MGTVLTTATTLVCPNKGTVQASSAAKLAVQQAAVLTAVAGDVVSNCGANPPCATVGAPTAGLASKLSAGGSPVLLDSIVVTSNTAAPITPDPTKLQTKLTAS